MYKSKTFASFKVTLPVFIFLSSCILLNFFSPQELFGAGEIEEDSLQLQIMSFNIRYGTANDGENHWKNRREMVFDVLRNHNPDVVGLQEALRFQIDQIRNALPVYGEIGVAREDGQTDGEYSAILYRLDLFDVNESGTFWFSDTPEIPGSSHWGNACVRICTWARFIEKKSANAFYVFNLHLDHISQPSREKSAVLLTQRLLSRNHSDPFIVTGDFNTGEDNPVILYLKGTAALEEDGNELHNPVPMVDTFRVLHPDVEDVGTFHRFNGNREGDKVDYVFTQPGFKVLEANILYDNINGRYPSDHYPVSAIVNFTIGVTYYIDSEIGSDQNIGDNPDMPWKTLAAVNNHTFTPGDKILFRAGTIYTGQLKPKGSGARDNPIVIDMYGQGPKPRIDGNGILDTVLLENIEYWELNNLEVTNLGPTRMDWRTGIRISANSCGTLNHIHLKNLYVHDVNGSNDKSKEGCGIFFECKGSTPSCFDGLLIENCHVVRTDRNGICGRSSFTNRSRNWFPSLKVVIRGNLLEDIGGDCIKPWGCEGCLVEYNVVRGGRQRAEDYAAGIWPWSCNDTVIQFNEVSGIKGTKDGQGFDSDYNSRNSLFQYNYSHDNDGGFMLICTPAVSSWNIGNEGTVIRYNISRNDGARIFQIGGPTNNTKIYNNVFYVPQDRDIYALLYTNWDGWAKDTYFYNNIFYVDGKVRYEFGQSTNNVFEHNVFYGNHENPPDDPYAITDNPMLVNPGSGGHGFDSLEGYKIRNDSPCIDAGIFIEDCGAQDFWGTQLPQDQNTDIGAYEITKQ